jgi:hypothetical protein
VFEIESLLCPTIRHEAISLNVVAISRLCGDVFDPILRAPTALFVGPEASSAASSRPLDVAIHQILAAFELFVDIHDRPGS